MKNRSILVVLAFLVIHSFESYSQETSSGIQFNNKFGVVVDNLFAKPSYEPNLIYNANNSVSITQQIHNIKFEKDLRKMGFIYKRNFNNCAIRSKVLFGIGNNKQSTDKYNSENKVFTYQINAGFEFQKMISKFQLIYGIDFFIHFKNAKTNITNINNADFFDELNSSSRTSGVGLSPFCGISYFIVPRLSISTELNFNYESYTVKDNSGQPGINAKGTQLFLPRPNIGVNFLF